MWMSVERCNARRAIIILFKYGRLVKHTYWDTPIDILLVTRIALIYIHLWNKWYAHFNRAWITFRWTPITALCKFSQSKFTVSSANNMIYSWKTEISVNRNKSSARSEADSARNSSRQAENAATAPIFTTAYKLIYTARFYHFKRFRTDEIIRPDDFAFMVEDR